MGTWAIAVEIRGSRIDAEGFAQFVGVLQREFPEFAAECELWSGALSVHGRVEATTPEEALGSALATISTSFAWARTSIRGVYEITRVTIQQESRASATRAESLPQTLLRRVQSRAEDTQTPRR